MTDDKWYRIQPYVSANRAYYEGLKPDYEGCKLTVCANLWEERSNDYVAHWDGETFDNLETAADFFDGWEPDPDEVRKTMFKAHIDGNWHYELEIGIWDEDGELVSDDYFWTKLVEV